MIETARLIRDELAKAGFTRRDVSVRCVASWKIIVKAKRTLSLDDAAAMKAATLRGYHARPHSWLCVRCNDWVLGMPPIEREGRG